MDGGRCGAPSLFRTGSGKPLAVKPDSVRKPMLVVGEDHGEGRYYDASSICSLFFILYSIFMPNLLFFSLYIDNAKIRKQSLGKRPMFQRGSGKPVSLKQTSIQRAPAVLGAEDFVVEGGYLLTSLILYIC